ncbi:hypothetical protein ACU4GD_09345 [Cupriavidus basilensis]
MDAGEAAPERSPTAPRPNAAHRDSEALRRVVKDSSSGGASVAAVVHRVCSTSGDLP